MLLKIILVTALASPTSAFKTGQKLVAKAFGASAGKNLCESIAFCSLKIRVLILTGYKQARGRFVAMPTLAVQSAATPKSGAEELCKKLSSTVAGTLGKPESYVMVTFQKVDAMCYAVRKSTSELG